MKNHCLIFLTCLFLASCSTTKSKKVEQIKAAAKANASGATPTPMPNQELAVAVNKLTTKFLQRDTMAVVVFLKVGFTQPTSFDYFSKNFTINYALYPDFGSKERLGYGNLVPDGTNTQRIDASNYLVTVNLKRPNTNPISALLLAEVVKIGTAQKATKDLTIRFKSTKLTDRLTMYDKSGQRLQMKNYITVNDTFSISGVSKTSQPLYVYRYEHNFDAANSPMNTSPRSGAKSLKIDTSFRVSTNQPLRFVKEGLYYMVQDTTDAFGLGIVVGDKRYPKMTRPTELVKPVMYVSQNQEIMDLKATKDPKIALDKYWLNMMNGNSELARQTIKAYYKRVEDANELFTTYKEGWKTDMGMVYIVMGPPDDTRRGRDREVWIYTQRNNFSEINFTFNRRPNQFIEDHYELQRYVEYQPIWYPIVESWRAGVVRD